MSFDERLAERIRRALKGRKSFEEKKMFGGIAFMLEGKMCVGVLQDQLVARVGPEQSVAALKLPHVRPMDFTGRPLKGYVYIGARAIQRDSALNRWIEKSVAFVSTLEGKPRSKAKRRTISELSPTESARNTPLSKLINFGPVTLPEFKAMGLTTFGQLEDLGWEEVCRKWVEHYPERLNVNAFIGVIATLEGISWTQVSPSDRAKARGLVRKIKEEHGLPAVPRKRRSATRK